jgi:hypothetical protein
VTDERFTTPDNIDISTDAASENSHGAETHTASTIPPLIIVGPVTSGGNSMNSNL